MSRIYASLPYQEKRPTESVTIQCPTGSDLTTSEREVIHELLADKFRTHRLYKRYGAQRQMAANFVH